MGVTVSSSHVVSATPSSSGGGLLTLYPCSSVKDPHGRQFSTNFSNVSPSHGLQLFMNCPSVGPFQGVQTFRNRLFQREVPPGSQALPENLLQSGFLSPWVCRSWQESTPAWAPHRVTASFRHTSAPAWGPFHQLQVDICTTVDLHGLQGNNLTHHGLITSCKGRISSLAC